MADQHPQSKISTPVTRCLEQQQIPYRLFTHTGEIRSLQQAAEERDQAVQQIVRSIVFRMAAEKYMMALIAGSSQISWQTLRRILGTNRISMANAGQVLDATGYQTGAVSPLGLPTSMRILVDQRILQQEEISIGSGMRGTTVIMQSQHLLPALEDAEVHDLCSECEA